MRDKLECAAGALTALTGVAVMFLASLPGLGYAWVVGAALMLIGAVKAVMGIKYE